MMSLCIFHFHLQERENSQAKKQTNLDQWLAVRTKVKQKTDGTPKVEQHRVGFVVIFITRVVVVVLLQRVSINRRFRVSIGQRISAAH